MTPANLDKLAQAIAQQEGFGVPGARPTRNHNPGDIRGWGAYPVDAEGFAVFPDDATGWAKLMQDLGNHAQKYPSQSLICFIGGDSNWPGYAPASDSNDPTAYAVAIGKALGVSEWTRFANL